MVFFFYNGILILLEVGFELSFEIRTWIERS